METIDVITLFVIIFALERASPRRKSVSTVSSPLTPEIKYFGSVTLLSTVSQPSSHSFIAAPHLPLIL